MAAEEAETIVGKTCFVVTQREKRTSGGISRTRKMFEHEEQAEPRIKG